MLNNIVKFAIFYSKEVVELELGGTLLGRRMTSPL